MQYSFFKIKSTLDVIFKIIFFPPSNRSNIYKWICLTYCSPEAPLSNVIIEEKLEGLAIFYFHLHYISGFEVYISGFEV